jgi:predicted RNA binding protein YcfA (HicA-like mRNA interferase family)
VRNVSGRELAKTLERLGWVLLRVQGSHHIYGKPGERAHISVPVHGNATLKPPDEVGRDQGGFMSDRVDRAHHNSWLNCSTVSPA